MKDKYRDLLDMVKDEFWDVREPGGGKAYRYYHALRTFRYSKKFLELDELKDIDIDREALLIAAIFHDMGGLKEVNDEGVVEYPEEDEVDQSESDHPKYSAEYIRENLDLEKNTMEKVTDIVKEHHAKDPENKETLILQDADNLDELGAMNVWRMLTYAGLMGQTFEEEIEYYRDVEKNRILEGVLEEFNFEKTRKIAERRVEKTRGFMEELEKEHKGEDIT